MKNMILTRCETLAPYIFVSYARVNRDKVRADVSGLQQHGCNVWLDEENMVGGKPVAQTDGIIRNPNCKALIFYMCERSVCSSYCLAELRVAKKYNIPIIPVHCFPVSGLEETIIKLQRHMESNEQVDVSDRLISEVLKTKNGSEMISIPYEIPTHLSEIINSIEGNGAGSVIIGPVQIPAPAPIPAPEPVQPPEPTPAPEPAQTPTPAQLPDALNILRYVAGTGDLSAQELANYDLNGDGAVTSADALLVLQAVADSSGAVPESVHAPESAPTPESVHAPAPTPTQTPAPAPESVHTPEPAQTHTPIAEEKEYCTECGTVYVPAEDFFCINCGNKLTQ